MKQIQAWLLSGAFSEQSAYPRLRQPSSILHHDRHGVVTSLKPDFGPSYHRSRHERDQLLSNASQASLPALGIAMLLQKIRLTFPLNGSLDTDAEIFA